LTQAGNSLRKEALQSPLIVDSLSRREGENNLPPGPFMTTEIRALYTRLPAIDRLLRDPAFSPLAQHGHSQVVAQLRQMLDEARE
jgi:hypothetical protein